MVPTIVFETNCGQGSKPDSVIVFTWCPATALRSIRSRRLITCLKRSQLCCCGCAGRCTILALLQVITWSIESLQEGRWPTTGPFGAPLHRRPVDGVVLSSEHWLGYRSPRMLTPDRSLVRIKVGGTTCCGERKRGLGGVARRPGIPTLEHAAVAMLAARPA